jgi:hypothetical protein
VYSQTWVNSHLPTTTTQSPAKANLIEILIEKPLKSSHLCSTATILRSQGWLWWTGLTAYRWFKTNFWLVLLTSFSLCAVSKKFGYQLRQIVKQTKVAEKMHMKPWKLKK